MTKKLLLLVLLFTSIYCFAQPCVPRELAIRPAYEGPVEDLTSEIPGPIVEKEEVLLLNYITGSENFITCWDLVDPIIRCRFIQWQGLCLRNCKKRGLLSPYH